MHRGLIDHHPAFGHHLSDLSQAQRTGRMPANAHPRYLNRVVQPPQNPAKRSLRLALALALRTSLLVTSCCDRTLALPSGIDVGPPGTGQEEWQSSRLPV